MTRSKKQKKKIRNFLIFAVVVIVVVVGATYVLNPASFIPSETSADVSTFTLISYVDGEDVSDFVEISVWIPDDDAEFDEAEDLYTMSNFNEEKSSIDADDVEIDLSDYSYVWIEIDPDAEVVFASNYHLIAGQVNYDYIIYVYHLSSDVNFNIVNDLTLASITASGFQTDGNFTTIMDIPHYTTTDIHVGTNWDVEQSDFDEYTTSEKNEVYDEANWRCQAPLYDPTVDTEKEFDVGLEQLTDAFAIRFTFNTTVSTVDGNAEQINMTVDSDEPIDIAISGTYIYHIFYEVIAFENAMRSYQFDMQFGVNISLSTVQSGRLVVPRGDDNLGTFTAYSSIGA